MQRLWIGTVLAFVFHSCQVAAQEERPENDEEKRSVKLFAHFDDTAKSLDIVTSESDETLSWQKAPLFRFSSEGTVFGSVYIWKDQSKRLAVIGTIGSIPIRGEDVEFVELHLLKPQAIRPLDLPGVNTKRWDPDVAELSLRPVPDAPAVADTARGRLVQMKSMARKFSATMVSGTQTNQLRLLPQPLFRYGESSGDQDGGLFAFIWDKGTDPEVLLRFEVAESDGESAWHYQPVRFTWRAVELQYGEKEVWRVDEFVERDRAMQSTPYVTGLTSAIP